MISNVVGRIRGDKILDNSGEPVAHLHNGRVYLLDGGPAIGRMGERRISAAVGERTYARIRDDEVVTGDVDLWEEFLEG